MNSSFAESSLPRPSFSIASAAWHSLLWLVVGNAIGVMIAILLLIPGLNVWLGEWTYGRWIVVHMNLSLYGWSSLPMAAFLFKAYGADHGATAAWCRPVLWAWSSALVAGSWMWLSGNSSGKLFLDWMGYSRLVFLLAMCALWVLLVVSFARNWKAEEDARWSERIVKLLGLIILLAVPISIYIASSPGFYPALDPETGGPTGTSQLESSLAIVAILLLVPFGLSRRKGARTRIVAASWLILAAESVLCAVLTHGDVTHRNPVQFASVASVLVWLPLVPTYYSAFEWHANTKLWRRAFLVWWAVLVVSGWVMFLPGVLDRFKFTDGLVGHSFIAMAGFASALLIFVMVQLLGEGGWIFAQTWSFHLWNASVLAYIVVVSIAGWLEGSDPAFTIVPGLARNILYVLRLITGVLMFIASIEWFIDASSLLRKFDAAQAYLEPKKGA